MVRKKIAAFIMATAACFAASIIGCSVYAQNVFLPHTSINTVDVSGLRFDIAKEKLEAAYAGEDAIRIYGRDFAKGEIKKKSIGWGVSISCEEAIRENRKIWNPIRIWKDKEYQAGKTVSYDEAHLKEQIYGLPFFQDDAMREPENAAITYNGGYQILSGDPGTKINKEYSLCFIKEQVDQFQENVSLNDSCYMQPEVEADDPALNSQLSALQEMERTCIIYKDLDDLQLDASVFHDWINTETLEIDKEAAAQWVRSIAAGTNTAYTTRTFLVGDRKVTATGPYGFRIDEEKETEQILADIRAGGMTVRTPIYAQQAASRGNELGNTFVEVDLGRQKVALYVDNVLQKESPCVSGSVAKGYTTPGGIYPLTYKQRNAVLRGPGYASPVSYWMPFNKGIGLHDANWRSSFGGTIYKTNGSHGCINLPADMAAAIYEAAFPGMAVICHE